MCSGFKYVTTSYCISCFQNIITLKHFVPIRVISYEAELYKLLLLVTTCLLISYDRSLRRVSHHHLFMNVLIWLYYRNIVANMDERKPCPFRNILIE